MSVQPIRSSDAIAADRDFLVRRTMSKGYQYFSLAVPPLFTAAILARKQPWSVNNVLRATWIGGVAGIAIGGGFEYLRTSYAPEDSLRSRRINAMYNVYSLRAEDHSTIGALLGATLTPAIFWKRARSIHLILGGAGIGAGLGLIVHWSRKHTVQAIPPALSSPSQSQT